MTNEKNGILNSSCNHCNLYILTIFARIVTICSRNTVRLSLFLPSAWRNIKYFLNSKQKFCFMANEIANENFEISCS